MLVEFCCGEIVINVVSHSSWLVVGELKTARPSSIVLDILPTCGIHTQAKFGLQRCGDEGKA